MTFPLSSVNTKDKSFHKSLTPMIWSGLKQSFLLQLSADISTFTLYKHNVFTFTITLQHKECNTSYLLVLQWGKEIRTLIWRYNTLRAGPFSLALSLARFPSSPSCTNNSSRFTSSSSTICSVCRFAAMLARALITAREQCLHQTRQHWVNWHVKDALDQN